MIELWAWKSVKSRALSALHFLRNPMQTWRFFYTLSMRSLFTKPSFRAHERPTLACLLPSEDIIMVNYKGMLESLSKPANRGMLLLAMLEIYHFSSWMAAFRTKVHYFPGCKNGEFVVLHLIDQFKHDTVWSLIILQDYWPDQTPVWRDRKLLQKQSKWPGTLGIHV